MAFPNPPEKIVPFNSGPVAPHDIGRQFDEHSRASAKIIDFLRTVFRSDGVVKETAMPARSSTARTASGRGGSTAPLGTGVLGPDAGGFFATDEQSAGPLAQDYAQVAIDWAEHMPDTIPPNTLAVMGITGAHWSSRWWANRAATVSPGAAASLYYISAASQTVFPLTTLDHFGKSYTLNQATPETIIAHINGVRLTPTSDFTVNVPTSTVTLVSPATLGAVVCFDMLMSALQLTPIVVLMSDNRIINGDMRIDQRNNGASGNAINVYTVDRWKYGATQAAKGSWVRGVPATGFGGYLNFTSSSAYAVLASDYFFFGQPIEADAVTDFMWGTANAQPVTLSFWAQSSLSGTFGGSIQNNNASRCYPFSYSLPSAGTWTKIAVTIPGDTAGTWVMTGNGVGLIVNFALGAGSTFSGPAPSWMSANNISVVGAVSVVGTNAAYFNVTGVKLEVGSVATPFNRYSLAKSMADCQWYYQVGTVALNTTGTAGQPIGMAQMFPVVMRATPTVAYGTLTSGNTTGGALNNGAGPGYSATNILAASTGYAWFSTTWTASAEL